MKRLCFLLLICVLLPLQVFAGQGASQPMAEAASARFSQQQTSTFDLLSQALQDDGASSMLMLGDADTDEESSSDDEDSFSHADASDDILLMPMPTFVGGASIFVPVLCRDDAHPSPFLPPAGRPPRA
jgi:hypothetical protein